MTTFLARWAAALGVATIRTAPAPRRHLTVDHDIPPTALAAATPTDWATWHHGEHSTRHPDRDGTPHTGHLRHGHLKYLPKTDAPKPSKAAS